MTTLVELCAGTASVSLHALGGVGPLTGFMGSKRRWAGEIVDLLGARKPDRVVLVDAGPWGDVWSTLATGGGMAVADALDAWRGWDVAELWRRLVAERPSSDAPTRAAHFLWLQARAAGNIPVWWSEERGEWRSPTGAVNDPRACTSLVTRTKGLAPSIAGKRGWGSGRRTAGLIADRVRAVLPLLGRVDVLRCDVRAVPPIPGARVLVDPPYVRAPRYAELLPRRDVLDLAERWRAAGARVLVCEAEPLPLAGWTALPLPRTSREWVTASWRLPVAPQLSLPGVAA